MRPPAIAIAALVAAVLLCAPAHAGFYSWRDASGRQHFAQELHQVPSQFRAQAEAARKDAGEGPAINVHDTHRRWPTVGSRAVDRGAQERSPAAQAPSAAECKALQRQVAKKRKVIRTHQGSVEANRRWADDIGRSAFSRRKYEARAEEEARWLARAEQDLERFLDEQRRRGVEPGCLR